MTRFSSLHRVGPLTALLLMGIAPALHAQIRYFITDLGTFGGTVGFGYAVNAQGQVAGASLTSGNNGYRAFRTAPNRPINPATDDLRTLGGVQSYAQSINNLGQVAGSAAITDSAPLHAFRTEPEDAINPSIDDLGTLGGTESEAWGINNLGQVVGFASTSDGTILHAFRTAPNRAINTATDDLGTLGGTESAAFGINDLGQVVGYASTSGGANLHFLHAFRTSPNLAINPATDDLGTLGGTESFGAAINNVGQVTGNALTSDDGSNHAFRTAPNRPINPATDDLGTLGAESYGMAINDLGQVVGYSFTTSDHTVVHAFLFSGSLMYDLNNIIPADSGWDLQQAFGINDAGQIVGVGAHSGQIRPFLLTPARKDLCKNSGWENFGFKSEGKCIQFVETGK